MSVCPRIRYRDVVYLWRISIPDYNLESIFSVRLEGEIGNQGWNRSYPVPELITREISRRVEQRTGLEEYVWSAQRTSNSL